MSVKSRSFPNLYTDSVSLITVSAKFVAVSGTDEACAEALQTADDLLSAKAGSQIGAGITTAPISCFNDAIAALSAELENTK